MTTVTTLPTRNRQARWPVNTVTLAAQSTSDSLAPDTQATTDTLTDQYNANNTITAYCHALLNIQLTWNTQTQGTQPQWFTDLSAGLVVAQQHANLWLVGVPNPPGGGAAIPPLGPTIFSTIPQSIIDYGNTFNLATNNILSIINSLPPSTPPTATQQAEINSLIDAILVTLQSQHSTIASVQTQLSAFASLVQDDHTTLLTGQNAAQAAVQLDMNQITTINAQIALVQTQIQSDSKLALSSEISLGVGIFMVVVGIALAVATDGAAAPLVLTGVGVLTTGAAIAGTVIFSKAVNDDLNKLYALQAQLSDEQRQVSALNGIINSVNALVQANEAATKAISDVENMMSVLIAKLQSVQQDLQNAEAANVPAIIEALNIQAAQLAWQQLVTFATNMQTNAITVQQPIVQPTVALAA